MRKVSSNGMDVREQVREYLNGSSQVMQVATVADGQPWIANVYFVVDDELNLYWLSLPARRHSREIAGHDKAAVSIAIKTDLPVIGIQAEGRAERVSDKKIVAKIMPLYTKKYGAGKSFYDRFVAGQNQHELYKFTPTKITLFDEVNFPDDGRKEIVLRQKI